MMRHPTTITRRIEEQRLRGWLPLIAFHIPGFPDPATALGALDLQDRYDVAVYEVGTPTRGKRSWQANSIISEALDAGRVDDLVTYRERSPVLAIVYEGFAVDPDHLTRLKDIADAVIWEWGEPGLDLARRAEAIDLPVTVAVNVTAGPAHLIAAAHRARGLLYVSMGPRTGERHPWPCIRAASNHLRDVAVPVCFGFGVANADDIKMLRDLPRCDGAVVGTALLRALRQGLGAYERCLAELMNASR